MAVVDETALLISVLLFSLWLPILCADGVAAWRLSVPSFCHSIHPFACFLARSGLSGMPLP